METHENRQPRFSVGDEVCLRSRPDRAGQVSPPLPEMIAGEYWYTIYFLAGRCFFIRFLVPSLSLCPVKRAWTPLRPSTMSWCAAWSAGPSFGMRSTGRTSSPASRAWRKQGR